jgi:hypothetical protein
VLSDTLYINQFEENRFFSVPNRKMYRNDKTVILMIMALRTLDVRALTSTLDVAS